MDVIEIDGASHTKVEETREILEQVPYTPIRGKYRIFIIDEAHMLSRASFNALLKTLEEPPPHTLFILATTEPDKIPETVRSRALEYPFLPVGQEKIVSELKRILQQEQISYEEPALIRIAKASEGSVRDALTLLDQVVTYGGGKVTLSQTLECLGVKDLQTVEELVHSILAGDREKTIELGRKLLFLGTEPRALLQEILHQLHGILKETLKEKRTTYFLPSGGKVEMTDLVRIWEGGHKALLEMVRSPLPDLYLEITLYKLSSLKPLGEIEELLSLLGKTSPSSPSFPPPPSSSPSSTKDPVGEFRKAFPLLEGGGAEILWDPPFLKITVPEDRILLKEMVEQRKKEMEELLKRITDQKGILKIEFLSPSKKETTLPTAVQKVLEIFPGSKVER
jgi:DNA polymerase-3 subunit gamma/tau